MRNRKKILMSILSLALCVLVSFAWMYEVLRPTGRLLTLKFEEAAIASGQVQVQLFMNVEDDTFREITKHKEAPEGEEPEGEASTQGPESYDDFAPGSRQKFRVDITNAGESSVRLRVLLSDIICENEELRESIIIGTNGFEGFDSNYPAPTVENKMLSDGMDASGAFILVDSVEIPPNKPVSIYFYVMFSASGSGNLEDMTFSIGTINFLTI